MDFLLLERILHRFFRAVILQRNIKSTFVQAKKNPLTLVSGLNPNLCGVRGDRCNYIAAQHNGLLYCRDISHSQLIYHSNTVCHAAKVDIRQQHDGSDTITYLTQMGYHVSYPQKLSTESVNNSVNNYLDEHPSH
jgi:hypothetical protein